MSELYCKKRDYDATGATMRILILINSPLYYRNYILSPAFADLEAENCYFATSNDLADQPFFRNHPHFSGTIGYDIKTVARHGHLFNVLTWRYRKRSKTFPFRIERLFGSKSRWWFHLFANSLSSLVTIPFLIWKVPVNPGLRKLIQDTSPELVVVPTGLMDHTAIDTARICRDMGIKTLFLVDNWDGLSSKTIMWAKPDYVGTWGEQTRQHAVSIQKIPSKNVFPVGSPRFECYFREPAASDSPLYDFPFILFTGNAIPFNELGALHILDEEIGAHPEIYGKIKIIYRPHPWRQPRKCPDQFQESDFGCVLMDRQMKDNYYDSKDVEFQPDLEYYRLLLNQAQLVIGPPTSMIVESLLCGTPVMTLVYDDGIHFESPDKAYANYTNLEGIDQMAGHYLVPRKEEIDTTLRQIMANPQPTKEQMRTSVLPFIQHGPEGYATRLRRIIDHIEREITANKSV